MFLLNYVNSFFCLLPSKSKQVFLSEHRTEWSMVEWIFGGKPGNQHIYPGVLSIYFLVSAQL